MNKQRKRKSKKGVTSASSEAIQAQVKVMLEYSTKEMRECAPDIVEYMDSDYRGVQHMREVYKHPRADYYMSKAKFEEYYTCSSCKKSYDEELSEFQIFPMETLAKRKTCPICVRTAFQSIHRNFV